MSDWSRLKLRAQDFADMDVIASVLQDAIVPLAEVAYLERERRFVMVVNRFMWERRPEIEPATALPDEEEAAADDGDAAFEEAEARPTFYRVNCGVTFDRVKTVSARGIDQADRRQLLNLLTVAAEPRRITLLFSGGGYFRLDVSDIRCHLEDIGEPWPTWAQPAHALDGRGQAG